MRDVVVDAENIALMNREQVVIDNVVTASFRAQTDLVMVMSMEF